MDIRRAGFTGAGMAGLGGSASGDRLMWALERLGWHAPHWVALAIALVSAALLIASVVFWGVLLVRHLRSRGIRVEPGQLIAGGVIGAAIFLAIAVSGIVWNYIETAKSEAAIPAPSPPSVPAKPPISAYDQTRKLALLDSQILPILKTSLPEVVSICRALGADWINKINNIKAYRADIENCQRQINYFHEAIAKSRRENEAYEDDIGKLLEQDYYDALVNSLGDLTEFLKALTDEPDRRMNINRLIRPYVDALLRTVGEFEKWRKEHETAFIKLRRETAEAR